MKNSKSSFWYNKSQRRGILLLSFLIISLQICYYYIDFSSNIFITLNTTEINMFQTKIDSLKHIEVENRKPKIYPFNPSFITDYKGYKLGMNTQEIDKLLTYRKQGKYINSPKQFQKVTGISNSLLNKLKPYFKFPDWINKEKKNNHNIIKVFKGEKSNLNFCNANELQKIDGIGEKLSKRIIKYRNSIGSFKSKEQLQKVYGLKQEVVAKILNRYYIIKVETLNSNEFDNTTTTKDLNKATAIDLKTINGIGEILANRIIKYRTKIKGFYFSDQLKEVYGLSPEVIKKINSQFKIITKPTIKKININEATFKEILHLPYINYELTKKIFNYRDEFAEIQSLEELKKIEGFPIDKYDRIILYLTTEYD